MPFQTLGPGLDRPEQSPRPDRKRRFPRVDWHIYPFRIAFPHRGSSLITDVTRQLAQGACIGGDFRAIPPRTSWGGTAKFEICEIRHLGLPNLNRCMKWRMPWRPSVKAESMRVVSQRDNYGSLIPFGNRSVTTSEVALLRNGCPPCRMARRRRRSIGMPVQFLVRCSRSLRMAGLGSPAEVMYLGAGENG